MIQEAAVQEILLVIAVFAIIVVKDKRISQALILSEYIISIYISICMYIFYLTIATSHHIEEQLITGIFS